MITEIDCNPFCTNFLFFRWKKNNTAVTKSIHKVIPNNVHIEKGPFIPHAPAHICLYSPNPAVLLSTPRTTLHPTLFHLGIFLSLPDTLPAQSQTLPDMACAS